MSHSAACPQEDSLRLGDLCRAVLQRCAVNVQEPRDILQTSAWRTSSAEFPRHILFPAIATEVQAACQLQPQPRQVRIFACLSCTSPFVMDLKSEVQLPMIFIYLRIS